MELVTASSLPPAAVDAVREIYEDAFDPRLRSSFENLLADPMFVLLDGGQPQGFAVLRALGPTGWIFLRYFAAGRRGQGVGSRLWVALAARLASDGYTRIIWDVEDPDEPGAEDAEDRRRRIVFYTRLGGAVLPVPDYHMPDGDQAFPMRLLAADLGVSGSSSSEEPIVDDELRRVVTAVFRWRYRLDEGHPLVVAALASAGR
jgi:GNAT superfamily N-acetyltransferase